jgi:hypothetical protein
MIQERIPFIISNGQIYLPFPGLDLAFRTNKEVIKPLTFTPTAQLLYLYFLYNKPTEINTGHISNLFKISKVHAARALRELYEKKLITFEVGGSTNRTRKYKRVKDPEYYQQGLRYLKNPVIGDVICGSETIHGPKCGLSALADQSLLAQPEYDTYAITKEERNHVAHNVNHMYHEFELIKLEVWSYDPRIVTKDKYVDILSLCLSLQHLDDPRVDEKIEKLLKGESWYRA